MFGTTDVDTDDVDVEKAAQAFREQYPDAPSEAAALYARLMRVNAQLDDIEKRRRRKAAVAATREALEPRVERMSEQIDRVAKKTADTQQIPTSMNGEDPRRAQAREAYQKEREVFTR